MPVTHIDVVPNGLIPPDPLPPGQRDLLRQAIGVPAERPFALFVGRLVKEKNLACLMRALARIPADQRPWVALAGNGPLRGDIDAMREAAGLDADVRFLGERKDTAALMQSADFLVLPSSYEGMSNVLMEAMAAGCPVVASDVGGNPELVEDGATGLLFPSDDADALARCLQAMGRDDALRLRLSQHAAQVARQRYSVEQLVRSTTRVYERCLEARATHAGDVPLSPVGSTRDDA